MGSTQETDGSGQVLRDELVHDDEHRDEENLNGGDESTEGAQWVVSRAMERNKVVTGLAQIVIVAESDIQGGTWEGANGALKQHRPLYVRQSDGTSSLPGNKALIELGGQPLAWPVENVAEVLAPLLEESAVLQQQKQEASPRPDQLSLFAVSNEA